MQNFSFLDGLQSQLQDYFKQQPTQNPVNPSLPGQIPTTGTPPPPPAPSPIPMPQSDQQQGSLQQMLTPQAVDQGTMIGQNPMAQGGIPNPSPEELMRLGVIEHLKQLLKFYKGGQNGQSNA